MFRNQGPMSFSGLLTTLTTGKSKDNFVCFFQKRKQNYFISTVWNHSNGATLTHTFRSKLINYMFHLLLYPVFGDWRINLTFLQLTPECDVYLQMLHEVILEFLYVFCMGNWQV